MTNRCSAALIGFLVAVALPAFAKPSEVETKRAEIRRNSEKILNELYKIQPAAKKVISSSAGYAVFSNFGMKIFVAGGGSGTGLAVQPGNKRQVFMRMVEVQAGLGLGIKRHKLVFAFESDKSFDNFVSTGWEAPAQQSTLAASDGKQGLSYQGAVSVVPGVWVYQMNSTGLASELTIKGTKYYKDETLN
jgi:lipid-binding SYLF domain-containing protein